VFAAGIANDHDLDGGLRTDLVPVRLVGMQESFDEFSVALSFASSSP
jgi:hypothetical protein